MRETLQAAASSGQRQQQQPRKPTTTSRALPLLLLPPNAESVGRFPAPAHSLSRRPLASCSQCVKRTESVLCCAKSAFPSESERVLLSQTHAHFKR